MKLGIFYTVFDGLELLQGAIDQIYKDVDVILICWQKVSNKGEAAASIVTDLIPFRRDKVHFLEYHPQLHLDIKEIERRKHNLAIQYLKRAGCTHFIMSATDHYYRSEEFREAKKILISSEYDVTFTNMYTYFRKPEWQLTTIEEYQMPFIHKMYPNTEIVRQEYPNGIKTDPSVRVNTRNRLHLFNVEDIMMHHYSLVRADISRKFRNAALYRPEPGLIKKYEEEYINYDIEKNPGVTYFGGRKIKVVPDYFEINGMIPSLRTGTVG